MVLAIKQIFGFCKNRYVCKIENIHLKNKTQ